jgi:hypothetical protein
MPGRKNRCRIQLFVYAEVPDLVASRFNSTKDTKQTKPDLCLKQTLEEKSRVSESKTKSSV